MRPRLGTALWSSPAWLSAAPQEPCRPHMTLMHQYILQQCMQCMASQLCQHCDIWSRLRRGLPGIVAGVHEAHSLVDMHGLARPRKSELIFLGIQATHGILNLYACTRTWVTTAAHLGQGTLQCAYTDPCDCKHVQIGLAQHHEWLCSAPQQLPLWPAPIASSHTPHQLSGSAGSASALSQRPQPEVAGPGSMSPPYPEACT